MSTCRKSAERGEAFYVAGCLFRCVACLVQVLFALNERYFTNEKGSIELVESFELRPPRLGETVTSVLGRTGDKPADLRDSIEHCAELVETTRGLTARVSPPRSP